MKRIWCIVLSLALLLTACSGEPGPGSVSVSVGPGESDLPSAVTTEEETVPPLKTGMTSSDPILPADGLVYAYGTLNLGTSWNPHTVADSAGTTLFREYLTDALYVPRLDADYLGALGTTAKFDRVSYVPSMAAAMPEDITKDLAGQGLYGIPADAAEGYAYRIRLNPACCWQDQTAVTAGTYLISLTYLLDSALRNPEANVLTEGAFRPFGAADYYAGGRTDYRLNGASLSYSHGELKAEEDGYVTPEGYAVYLAWNQPVYFLTDGSTLRSMLEPRYTDRVAALEKQIEELTAQRDMTAEEPSEETQPESGEEPEPAEPVPFPEETELAALREAWDTIRPGTSDEGRKALTPGLWNALCELLRLLQPEGLSQPELEERLERYFLFAVPHRFITWDQVGIWSEDEETLCVALEEPLTGEALLKGLNRLSAALIREDLYVANLRAEGDRYYSTYATGMDSTLSFGPYLLSEYEEGKRAVLTRNENWHGWEEDLCIYQDPSDGLWYRMYAAQELRFEQVSSMKELNERFLKGEWDTISLEMDEIAEKWEHSDRFRSEFTDRYLHVLFAEEDHAAAKFRELTGQRESGRALAEDYETATLPAFRKMLLLILQHADTLRTSVAPEYLVLKPVALDTAEAADALREAYGEALERGYVTDSNADGLCDQNVCVTLAFEEESFLTFRITAWMRGILELIAKNTPLEGRLTVTVCYLADSVTAAVQTGDVSLGFVMVREDPAGGPGFMSQRLFGGLLSSELLQERDIRVDSPRVQLPVDAPLEGIGYGGAAYLRFRYSGEEWRTIAETAEASYWGYER